MGDTGFYYRRVVAVSNSRGLLFGIRMTYIEGRLLALFFFFFPCLPVADLLLFDIGQ